MKTGRRGFYSALQFSYPSFTAHRYKSGKSPLLFPYTHGVGPFWSQKSQPQWSIRQFRRGMATSKAPTGNDSAATLTNRLAESTSPYVRGHKDNPVAWQEWNESTLNLARKLDRLIFLSIGYSACHWCHVMERESFMSPEVAAILNESFIPIKVDRESRPDIDEIYMNYVTATTGSGGWPLNVFITPDLDPVFGGTYWPGPNSTSFPRLAAAESLNFLEVSERVRDVWQMQRQKCLQSAKDISAQLKSFAEEGTHGPHGVDAEPLELDLLDEALNHFRQKYDKINGGFSHAPKFPTPPNLGYLLALGGSGLSTSFSYPKVVRSIAGEDACVQALAMVEHTLVAMSRGGVRDLVGHGFHRYSVTPDWSLPHFEKMLYDNGQLLSVYSAAFSITHNPEILGVIYSLIEYLTSSSSSIVSGVGGLFSSEDADSLPNKSTTSGEKREGAYYVFSRKELAAILPDEQSVQLVASHFNIVPDGNVDQTNDPHDEFLGQNVLSVTATPSKLANDFGHNEEDVVKILKKGRSLLSEYRDRERPRPDTDTKIVVGWNALAIKGLLDAYTVLVGIDEAKAKQALSAAKKIASFIKEELWDPTSLSLKRVWSLMPNGTGKKDENEAFLDDYAYLIQALISLYETTFESQWLQWADQLQVRLNTSFLSPDNHAFYSTPKPSNSVSTTPSEKPNVGDLSSYNPTPTITISSEAPTLPLRLKPGTDNIEPSANAITAQNLLSLATLLEDSKYASLAASTVNAFAVEIVQHPFLFVNMLNQIVRSQVGLRNVTLVTSTPNITGEEVSAILKQNDITRDSRTLVSCVSSGQDSWLKQRNELLRDIKPKENGKDVIMICENGSCRELQAGEKLEDKDEL